MTVFTKTPFKPSNNKRLFGLAAGLVMTAGAVAAQGTGLRTPVEMHPDRFVNFTTANLLPAGTLRLWVGSHQTAPGKAAVGTANQTYYGGVTYAVSPRFQIGIGHSEFHDPPVSPIGGVTSQIRFHTTSLEGKVGLVESGPWKVAVQGSVEQFIFRSPYFGIPTAASNSHVVGSLHVPVSYSVSDALQLHVTPGVSALPDTIGGLPFYGTVASLGAGFSYKPSLRWTTYGAVNVPLSGGNSISSAGAIEKKPVLTLGARFNISPKGALDVFVTNGLGVSPATRIMTMFPDGDQFMVGATMTYTPGRGPAYRPNYRGLAAEPLTMRQRHLQRDGFTLASADTLTPGIFVGRASGGSDGAYAGELQFSPDYDGQIDVSYEKFANDGSVPVGTIPSRAASYALGLKLRFMDQNNGSPFSLSMLAKLGRDRSGSKNGTFFIAMPMMYKASPKLALMASPKAAAFSSKEYYGLGLGVNYEIAPGLEVIGEVTPVSAGQRTVWATGLRYYPKNSSASIDLSATNAIGSEALGSMIGQSDVRVSLGITLALDARGFR
ncbi:hypothetical protein [Shimia aestuarii]|uniref:hypothetical protein n=1 Tax=Shimia aestuarii TaxID=254406 RepID=UPI001FB21FAA|nr:hypothetical protein [Shimia aestuarii]